MTRSEELFERALQVIPGGVNSPVRAYGGVGGTPLFVARGDGAWIEDADGRRYVDLVQSWGALLFGHARPEIVEAVIRAAARGTSFGAPTEAEVELAERVRAAMPGVEMLRVVSSGTEAAMSAVRLARGATGRTIAVKFEGCYHGHSDALLVSAGSGIATLSLPGSDGVTAGAVADTLLLPYNDVEAVRRAFTVAGDTIACVLVEPVAANMGVVAPEPGFLGELRGLCDAAGALLVFDEVITGFRLGPAGAQGAFGIRPDLTVLGKVIGGGLPMAAFGGRADVMERLAPLGGVYQAGTLSGNPIAVAAGLKTLQLIQAPGFYDTLAARTTRLVQGLAQVAREAKVPFSADSLGGMFGLYFTKSIPTSFAEVTKSDVPRFNAFFHKMLDAGVYFAPSAYEAGFVSIVHDDAIIDATIDAARGAFASLAV
jgi:glutamate-1-semialdehyde 2,1-aminomutase